MKRPAFQFYPADWRNNAKLRRCSEAARGAWIDVMCLMHDSDEYGVLRWPLAEIAHAAGLPLRLLRELSEKTVLKGGDTEAPPYIYTPRHAGKAGTPVTLVEPDSGPCWYCTRLVRDEWVRNQRGGATRFSAEQQPSPKDTNGERQGDGPTTTSTTSLPTSLRSVGTRGRKAPRAPMPEGFSVSERVSAWALSKNFDRLEDHLEAFKLTVEKHGCTYANWDSALMEAIREDWAGLRTGAKKAKAIGSLSDAELLQRATALGASTKGLSRYQLIDKIREREAA